jgi:hypothetical protein
MDAKVYNECEKQFVQMILSLNKYFDSPLEIEVYSRDEGGVIGKYTIKIAKNAVFMLLLGAAVSRFFDAQIPEALSPSEETGNKLENIQKISELVKSGDLTPELYDYATANDKELQKFKSNFFKSAKNEEKINRIEVEKQEDSNNEPSTQTIAYGEFDACILKEEKTEEQEDIDAKVYIVAPILIKGRKDAWKGIYNDESIEFRVTDKEFLEQVYSHTHNFSNGSYINCKMRVKKIYNWTTDKETIYREVFEVIDKGDDSGITQIQRRKKTKKNNIQINQPTLFSDSDFQ